MESAKVRRTTARRLDLREMRRASDRDLRNRTMVFNC
jgi:hypothetical protein